MHLATIEDDIRVQALTAERSVDRPPLERETLSSRLLRTAFNWFPCYRRTGARLTHLSADRLRVRLEIPLNWRTRGYWGTTFGGALYGAIDPVLLVIISRALGDEYMVWDQSAEIEFLRPGRSTLHADIGIEADEIAEIERELKVTRKLTRSYEITLHDARGVAHVRCKKRIYIRSARKKEKSTA